MFDADSTGGRMSFSFPDPSADRSIVVPDESGSMLTSSSRDSVLTSVGALVAGSIGGDFGDELVALATAQVVFAEQSLLQLLMRHVQKGIRCALNRRGSRLQLPG